MALEHLLQAEERQAIGIFRGDDVGQQRRGGDTFAQRMHRALGREEHFFAIALEYRLLLPDLQYLELSGEATKGLPAQDQRKASKADMALGYISKLYAIERELRDGSDAERYQGRQTRSVPLLA